MAEGSNDFACACVCVCWQNGFVVKIENYKGQIFQTFSGKDNHAIYWGRLTLQNSRKDAEEI